jgi:hypothetical protein
MMERRWTEVVAAHIGLAASQSHTGRATAGAGSTAASSAATTATSSSTSSTLWCARPVSACRASREVECALIGRIGRGRCPHWLIGGNNTASRVLSSIGFGAWQGWWLAEVTSSASFRSFFTRLCVASVCESPNYLVLAQVS